MSHGHHLGSRLSALVDGQLPPAAAERALEHVATCPACADELRAARA
ncbi:zf-HC2 domain-containing protein, partial [Actinotalea ferrariae]